jgi:hypothetical protein
MKAIQVRTKPARLREPARGLFGALFVRRALLGLLTLAGAACNWRGADSSEPIESVRSALTNGAVQINCGGTAVAPFTADDDFSGGATRTRTNAIDLSAAYNAAPPSVYQSQRYNNMSYTLPGFIPGSYNKIRLHFADTHWTTPNSRLFQVTINGAQVLNLFDIIGTVGAGNKALVETFTLPANSSGQYVIQFVGQKDAATINGIEAAATRHGQKYNGIQLNKQNKLLSSNAFLADLDGDGIDEVVSWDSTSGYRIFVRSGKTVDQDGFAHLYPGQHIEKVFGGRFNAGGTGDQICVQFDKSGTFAPITCYAWVPTNPGLTGGSGARQLAAVSVQNSNTDPFANQLNGQFAVGDFDADGADDVMVVDYTAHTTKFFSKATPTSPFVPAAITSGPLPALPSAVFVGQFGGDIADDILVQNADNSLSLFLAVNSSGRTFAKQWTKSGLVATGDVVHVARCHDSTTDCIVINSPTGSHPITWLDANAAPITDVGAGDLPASGNLIFGALHDHPSEPGSDKRDDVLVQSTSGVWSTFTARHSSTAPAFTYKSAWSANPTFENGGPLWQNPAIDTLTVVKCRYQNGGQYSSVSDPYNPGYVVNFFSSDPTQRAKLNLYDFWNEIFFGDHLLNVTVSDTWVTSTLNDTTACNGVPNCNLRQLLIKDCVTQAGLTYNQSNHYAVLGNYVCLVPGGPCSGADGLGSSILNSQVPGEIGEDIGGEEILHGFGQPNHGVDVLTGCDYRDLTDVISAENTWTFSSPGNFQRTGPLLSLPNELFLDPPGGIPGGTPALPSTKIVTLPASPSGTTVTNVTISALTRPENTLPLVVRLRGEPQQTTTSVPDCGCFNPNATPPKPACPSPTYTWNDVYITLRLGEGYDLGFGPGPNNNPQGVFVQGWANGGTGPQNKPILVTNPGLTQGKTFPQQGWKMTVNSVDALRGRASLTITN